MRPVRSPNRVWMPISVLVLALALACGSGQPTEAAAGGEVEAAAWGRVLARHVRDGGVDYAALAEERGELDRYLGSLAAADPARGPQEEQTAFWINAYNAVVIHLVLERYPDLESVKDVDGFFDRLTFAVAGQQRTLDQIETAARDLGDPRVHFAVVCASTSCPDLRPEPYVPERLDAQLADQTRRFLADPTKGLRYDREADRLWLSSIFKWYAGDFTGGSTAIAFLTRGGIFDWVVGQVPQSLGATLRERKPSVRYLDYDWGLNDRPGGTMPGPA